MGLLLAKCGFVGAREGSGNCGVGFDVERWLGEWVRVSEREQDGGNGAKTENIVPLLSIEKGMFWFGGGS